MSSELIMLGTGSAFPSRSYNTCFAIRTPSTLWMVDGGGGNGIFRVLEKAGLRPDGIHHLFITHVHTDHILGAVWILRGILNTVKYGRYEGHINLYGNNEVINALREICRLTFLPDHFTSLLEIADFHTVGSDTRIQLEDIEVSFFDVSSENVCQTGFRMTLPDGKTLVTLGDESLTERNAPYACGADYLLCGAFCRYADRAVYKPYEKHHRTVRDVAQAAEKAHIGTLVLYHSEDATQDKENAYKAETASHFSGRVIVPCDNTVIEL